MVRDLKLKVSSQLFKAETKDGEIKTKIKALNGQWIESVPYPTNPKGITAVLDLAINVHCGKLMLRGVEVDKRRMLKGGKQDAGSN